MKTTAFVLTIFALSSALAQTPSLGHKTINVAGVTKLQGSGLKSFREWKNEKVLAATQREEQAKNQLKALRAKSPVTQALTAQIENQTQDLAQEEWNHEIAEDLSITDYVALYLTRQSSPNKLAEAASKMTPEETAKILEAYIHSMGSLPTDGHLIGPLNALQTR